MTGAVQPKINQNNMNNLPVIIPGEEIISLFSKMINPTYAMFRSNVDEINSLSKLRDSLLPKLMSGEIRVKMG